jgi:hypothetical protein
MQLLRWHSPPLDHAWCFVVAVAALPVLAAERSATGPLALEGAKVVTVTAAAAQAQTPTAQTFECGMDASSVSNQNKERKSGNMGGGVEGRGTRGVQPSAESELTADSHHPTMISLTPTANRKTKPKSGTPLRSFRVHTLRHRYEQPQCYKVSHVR